MGDRPHNRRLPLGPHRRRAAPPEARGADPTTIGGTVERVTFHNPDTGFCVLRLKVGGRRELETVVGHVASVAAGEEIRAVGEWLNDLSHGLQFTRHLHAHRAAEQSRGHRALPRVRPDPGHRAGVRAQARRGVRRPRVRGDRRPARPASRRGRHRPGPRRADRGGLGGAEGHPRHHGVPPRPRRRHVARGADLQDLRRRRDRAHHGEPLPACARHPGHRLPDRRRACAEARHREDRGRSAPGRASPTR